MLPPCAFTLRNAVESVAIFGELGASKSTGSAGWILLKDLQLGMYAKPELFASLSLFRLQ